MTKLTRRRFGALSAGAALLAAPRLHAAEAPVLRVGHFPNVTHVQALVAQGLSRHGKGWFEARLPEVKIEWFIYNAGPSATEAIFAEAIDLTYIGPGPALNAYARSHGAEIRIVAGAVNGGSALVVQPGEHIEKAADLKGKRLATPQLGNTQDVAARAWLAAGGLHVTLTGGDVEVIPTANPDQLTLFKTKRIDAVWTVEPWVSRLVDEAGGRVLLDERDAITTVLVARAQFLAQHRALAAQFVQAHDALTDWIIAHPEQAQALVHDELEAETHGKIGAELVAQSWKRITLVKAPPAKGLATWVTKAQTAGFLRNAPDLSKLVEPV